MNIIVDEVIAVLEILPFGNTVCGDQNIQIRRIVLYEKIPFFGYRGEAGKDRIQIAMEIWDGGAAVYGAGDFGCVQSQFLFIMVLSS